MVYYLCAGCMSSGMAQERELTRVEDQVYCRACKMEGKDRTPPGPWQRLRLWLARRR